MKPVNTLAALLFVSGTAVGAAPASPSPGEPTLAEVRKLTERFQDVDVALAEGYLRDPFDLCDTAEMMGRPLAVSISRAFSTLVPSSRTTRGTLKPTFS